MQEESKSGEGPAKQPSTTDPLQLLRDDLQETSALLRHCSGIAQDGGNALAQRLPAMGAAAQLARASVQIARLLRDETRHADERGVVVHERFWEVPRTSSHPPLQRGLERWHAQNDAGKAAAEALNQQNGVQAENPSSDFPNSTGSSDGKDEDWDALERLTRP